MLPTNEMPDEHQYELVPPPQPKEEEDDSSPPKQQQHPSKGERLSSLDLQRGLTIAGMIFADEIGDAYPHLNHSPWNHVTMADFIMPWFLFMVGTSMAYSLRKYSQDRIGGTKHILLRAFKLFALGVLIQGGGMPHNYSYGYNLYDMRFCGILQRIAFGYLVVALCELWLPVWSSPTSQLDTTPDRTVQQALVLHFSVFRRHVLKWAVALGFTAVYLILLYATYVPTWTITEGKHVGTKIECNVRGEITPACCAIGYYDRLLFGQQRTGSWMSSRSEECSSCSPGKSIYSTGDSCKIPGRPAW